MQRIHSIILSIQRIPAFNNRFLFHLRAHIQMEEINPEGVILVQSIRPLALAAAGVQEVGCCKRLRSEKAEHKSIHSLSVYL